MLFAKVDGKNLKIMKRETNWIHALNPFVEQIQKPVVIILLLVRNYIFFIPNSRVIWIVACSICKWVPNWIITENGICTAPDHCACEIGWEGALCNVCVRLPGCLNGDCTEALECNCHEGWTGGYCDMRKQLIISIFHDVVIIKIEFQNRQVWFIICSF